MNKKVLVIVSSPRKGGNSELLCDSFIKGARENGNEVEKLLLRERKSHPALPVKPVCVTEGRACRRTIWPVFSTNWSMPM